LGKSTVDPFVTTSRWGSNDLFFCRKTPCIGFASGALLTDTNQTTAETLAAGLAPS